MDFGFHWGYGRPDERSFTDHHLIELMRRHPVEVKTAKIDQNREAETGADFEWWLGDGVRYLPMRVQAKKRDLESASYLGLRKQAGASGERQIDRLLQTAEKDGFLALYYFFNGPPSSAAWPHDRCENSELGESFRGAAWPWLQRSRRQWGERGSLAQISPISWPWQCLTCCPQASDDNPGQRALDVLRREAPEAVAASAVETTSELPTYVERLRAAEDPGQMGPLEEGEPLPRAGTVLVMTPGS
jgi:hypothetical protein